MRLRFGKFHGFTLILLGVLLLGLQAWVLAQRKGATPGAASQTSGSTNPGREALGVHHAISSLPGFFGATALILGALVIYSDRNRPPSERG